MRRRVHPVPDTRCLVDLTLVQRDYLLTLIEEERAQLHRDDTRHPWLDGAERALEDAMEVTEPWYMMGTRADGAAVGRGSGPIGGCARPEPHKPVPNELPMGPPCES